jgi:hypothetical protein
VYTDYLDDSGSTVSEQPVVADTSIQLTSSEPAVSTISPSVTVAANASRSDNATLIGGTPGTTLITASAVGFDPSDEDRVQVIIVPAPGEFQAVIPSEPTHSPLFLRILEP